MSLKNDYSITLSSFQRTKSERNDLSKPSKKLVASNEIFSQFNVLAPKVSYGWFSIKYLHRKEVIHPHVLVGIPCYDFTPVTDPALTGPLLKG